MVNRNDRVHDLESAMASTVVFHADPQDEGLVPRRVGGWPIVRAPWGLPGGTFVLAVPRPRPVDGLHHAAQELDVRRVIV